MGLCTIPSVEIQQKRGTALSATLVLVALNLVLGMTTKLLASKFLSPIVVIM